MKFDAEINFVSPNNIRAMQMSQILQEYEPNITRISDIFHIRTPNSENANGINRSP